jgi:hypothetical protein
MVDTASTADDLEARLRARGTKERAEQPDQRRRLMP